MGPGYDVHFDCAADEGYSDDLWLMERRRRRAAAFDDAGHPDAPALSNRQPDPTVPDGAQSAAPPTREETS